MVSHIRVQEMVEQVTEANHKWWLDLHTGEPLRRNIGEMCCLIVSELVEAMEGHRKDLMDDKLPHRKMAEVELVDTIIRLMDMVGHLCHGGVLWSVAIPHDFFSDDNFGSNLFQLMKEVANIERYPRSMKPYCFLVTAILSLMERNGMDFEGAWADKMEYNAVRHDHTRAGRLAPGGKAY